MVIVLEKELAALSIRPGDDVKPVLDKIKDTYARMAAAGSNVSQMQQCTKIIAEDFRRRHTGGGAANKIAEGYGAAGGSQEEGGGRGRGRGRGFGRERGRGDYNEGHGSSGGRGGTRMEGPCCTSGMGLVLGGRARVVLTGHADASRVDDLATQHSSQGYTFSLGSSYVSWRSTRSSSVLSSSCEAEIYAGAMAAQELRWLTYLLIDLGEAPRSPPVVYVDNKAKLALCQEHRLEHRLEHRTKHIALRYFLARELQQRGQLRLAYRPSRQVQVTVSEEEISGVTEDGGEPEVEEQQQQQQQDAPPRTQRPPDRPRRDVRPPTRLNYPSFGKPKVVRAGSVAEQCDEDEIAHCYWAAVPEPKTLAEALSGPDAEKWKQSVKEEYDSLLENETWELCELPPGKKAISSKLTLRPEGLDDGSGRLCRLKKAIYGLKQAPRAWYHELEETLAGGLKKSECDHCLFLMQEKEQFLVLLVYVDDILLFSESSAMIERVEEMLEMQPQAPRPLLLTVTTAANATATTAAATAASTAPANCTALASLRVLAFDHEGRPIQFDTWLDDLQLYLLSDIKDGVSQFDHKSGAATAPPTTADGATRSQWLSRDAAARLAIRNHLPLAECAHFGQHRTAQALYDAVVARYSSPTTVAPGRLLLPYQFPDLSSFATVEDLVSHLHASDARYRTALPAEFLDKNQPPMFITLYFIVTRLPDSLRSVRDHFLSLDPTSLTVDLLEQHLLAAETSAVADIGAASASAKRRSSMGKGGKGGGGGGGGGEGGSGSSGGGSSGGGGDGGTAGGSGGSGGGGGGSSRSGGSGGSGTGGGGTGAWHSGSGGDRAGQTCRWSHTQHRCFSRLDDAWRAEFGDDVELPRWADLLKSRIAIFDLDFDAILSAMYALSVSAEGDCYRCVSRDPGIVASALGASASGTLPGIAPAEALHIFTLDSGASRCFFCDNTTLTPLPATVPVRLADPSWGPVAARSSTVLSCPAVPSGSPSESMLGMGLVLGGRSPVVLIGHADASWVDDSATQRSSQGYTFSLGSGSVSWQSTRSSSVLSSSCEAEIYAGAMAAQELRWLTYLLTDLGEQPRSPRVLGVRQRQQWGVADLGKGEMLLTCYTDSSFNSVKADGTSIGGYVCMFRGGAVSWRSKKQNEVGLSSCETEYMALCHGVKEVVLLRRLLEEIGVCQREPTMMFCDNESAVKMAKNACLHELTKHIRPKWHWVRRLLDKEVRLEIVKTQKQAADILTKCLTENEHWKGMKLAEMSVH
ncbi:unnamed protein product [Closterium sp. NIES-54]